MTRESVRHVSVVLLVLTCFMGILYVMWLYTESADHANSSVALPELKHKYQHPVPCQVEAFLNSWTNSSTLTPKNLHLLSFCHHVLYARSPKCGSRAVRNVFEKLAPSHGFDAKRSAFAWPPKNVSDGKLVVTRHTIYSVNRDRGHVLLNVIREPISQMISMYSYGAYSSNLTDRHRRANVTRPAHHDRDTLNSCLDQRGIGPPCYTYKITALRYLCGSNCSKKNMDGFTRLQIAKKNVESKYLVVGVVDELNGFFEVLGTLMPHMFSGATDVFQANKEESRSNWATRGRFPLSNQWRDRLQLELKDHIELYQFVRARFYRMLTTVRQYRETHWMPV